MNQAGEFLAFATGTNTGSTDILKPTSKGGIAGADEVRVQVEILTGTPTVKIQARLSPNLSWVDVETGITANGIYRVGRCAEIRLTGTGSNGTFGGGVLV